MYQIMLKKLKEHLTESEMSYFKHLRHSIHQSNRLIGAAIKSYIHGLIPFLYKSDAPKTVVRIYNDIKKIKHLRAKLIDNEDMSDSR
jgi:hypothetical protein